MLGSRREESVNSVNPPLAVPSVGYEFIQNLFHLFGAPDPYCVCRVGVYLSALAPFLTEFAQRLALAHSISGHRDGATDDATQAESFRCGRHRAYQNDARREKPERRYRR